MEKEVKGIGVDKEKEFGYEIKDAGDLLQIDTIVRFEHGIKRYILTGIDIVTKLSRLGYMQNG